MKRKFKIILVALVLSLLVACKKEKVANYDFLYPEIDDQVLVDLENGHHTSYFNKEDLAFEYLEKVYPDKDFDLVDSSATSDSADLSFKEKDQDLKVDLKLEKVDIEGPNETLSIWTVKTIKEN